MEKHVFEALVDALREQYPHKNYCGKLNEVKTLEKLSELSKIIEEYSSDRRLLLLARDVLGPYQSYSDYEVRGEWHDEENAEWKEWGIDQGEGIRRNAIWILGKLDNFLDTTNVNGRFP